MTLAYLWLPYVILPIYAGLERAARLAARGVARPRREGLAHHGSAPWCCRLLVARHHRRVDLQPSRCRWATTSPSTSSAVTSQTARQLVVYTNVGGGEQPCARGRGRAHPDRDHVHLPARRGAPEAGEPLMILSRCPTSARRDLRARPRVPLPAARRGRLDRGVRERAVRLPPDGSPRVVLPRLDNPGACTALAHSLLVAARRPSSRSCSAACSLRRAPLPVLRTRHGEPHGRAADRPAGHRDGARAEPRRAFDTGGLTFGIVTLVLAHSTFCIVALQQRGRPPAPAFAERRGGVRRPRAPTRSRRSAT